MSVNFKKRKKICCLQTIMIHFCTTEKDMYTQTHGIIILVLDYESSLSLLKYAKPHLERHNNPVLFYDLPREIIKSLDHQFVLCHMLALVCGLFRSWISIKAFHLLVLRKIRVCEMKKKCGQKVKGGDSGPLLQSSETPPGVLHPAWGLQQRKDMDLLEWVQRRAMKMIRELEYLS